MRYWLKQNEATGIYYLWDYAAPKSSTGDDFDGRAYAFATYGQGAEEVGRVLRACQAFFDCATIVACPGSGTGATVLQGLCDNDISFTPIRSRGRSKLIVGGEKKRLKIKRARRQVERALVVAELVDSGHTLDVYCHLTREHGAAETVPFAVGHTPGAARSTGILYVAEENCRLNQAELAQFLGISKRWVQKLVRRGVLPAPVHRQYDSDKAAGAYIRYLQEVRQRKGRSYIAEKTRLTKEQADEKALKNEMLRSRLIPVDQVRQVWAKHLLKVRTKFESLPDRLGPEIAAMERVPEIEAYLRRQIYAVLNELAASQVEE
jgi:phage terminase Nu1 subunit (DNA packaging protein)